MMDPQAAHKTHGHAQAEAKTATRPSGHRPDCRSLEIPLPIGQSGEKHAIWLNVIKKRLSTGGSIIVD
ncbi:hypothetical protein PX699_17310 [Sphingobium sp. H39-3-25]|uniref:hypothetical protein n=1 Tax=Sphingobium arseniciresistens TaxID=3030834 RepID=UPI0023B91112|nr:hypothetical protein [Sphingobium arseniciresistens]